MSNNEGQVKLQYTTPKLVIHGDIVSIVKNSGGDCNDGNGGIGIGVLASDGFCYNSP